MLHGLVGVDVAPYVTQVEAAGPAAVAAAARTIRPEALTWVVVGDLARIEPALRELGVAPVQVLDADGQPLAR